MGYNDDYRYSREAQECNLMIVWSCPQCRYEYEERPGCNENAPCPNCQIPCQESGESYDG